MDETDNEGCLVEMVDPILYAPFDATNCNNWKESSLREWLNGKFLDMFIGDYDEDIVPTHRDLTTNDGLCTYGSCDDMVTILTTDEYRKTRVLHTGTSDFFWLITADSTADGETSFVCVVIPSGSLNFEFAKMNLGVRPSVSLKPSVLVRI